jgi:hypothetical protein
VNTAVNTHHTETRGETPGYDLGWITALISGVRWGIEMRRRYDSEVAAGRRPDADAMRRMSGEVDAWLGR